MDYVDNDFYGRAMKAQYGGYYAGSPDESEEEDFGYDSYVDDFDEDDEEDDIEDDDYDNTDEGDESD